MAVAGMVVAGAGVLWAGAALAALMGGGRAGWALGEFPGVVSRLAETPGDPAAAWGRLATGLPGPVVYWAATGAVAMIAAAGVIVVVWGWRRVTTGGRVHRFGVDTEARVATSRDLAPLVVTEPTTGRVLLGRVAHGRRSGPLLATEDRARHPARSKRARARQGGRGSVALFGPTQAGKTTAATAAILAWDGPAIVVTLKRDLFDATATARAARGELAVFDPAGSTRLPSARWSPLSAAITATGAKRAGRAVGQAIPRSGVDDSNYWAQLGEDLLAAYFGLAGLSNLLQVEPLTMQRVASWAYLEIGAEEPVAQDLIRAGINDDRLEVKLLARQVATQLIAMGEADERMRTSIFTTARTAVAPWLEPGIGFSATLDPRHHYDSAGSDAWKRRPRWVDLDWLMGGTDQQANTLYLSAPDGEFARLAPVLGGLLGSLKDDLHAWDVAGRKLDKPLLIVIDEAGQLKLDWLPTEVATVAGLGAVFLTCWQSRAQISSAYGSLADAVLGSHRTKLFFSGTDDPSTVELVSRLAGGEHVTRRGWSADVAGGRRTVSGSESREDLAPAHVVRQMRPGDALMLHGTLPPAHVRAVRWHAEPFLASLVPTDEHGWPRPPQLTATCPLSGAAAGPLMELASPVEDATLLDALTHLPRRQRGGPGPVPADPASGDQADHGDRPQLTLLPAPPPGPSGPSHATNRTGVQCCACHRWIAAMEGRVRKVAGDYQTVCAPCDEQVPTSTPPPEVP